MINYFPNSQNKTRPMSAQLITTRNNFTDGLMTTEQVRGIYREKELGDHFLFDFSRYTLGQTKPDEGLK